LLNFKKLKAEECDDFDTLGVCAPAAGRGRFFRQDDRICRRDRMGEMVFWTQNFLPHRAIKTRRVCLKLLKTENRRWLKTPALIETALQVKTARSSSKPHRYWYEPPTGALKDTVP
jgi:hypothetical protein